MIREQKSLKLSNSLFKTKMWLSISEAGSPIPLELSNFYLTVFLFGQSVFSNQLL